ncbi:AI-2E family transporter [candidate division KSB1 bacterium]|nr:AI-2E family transporter [candidate division KSB1 bacterium]
MVQLIRTWLYKRFSDPQVLILVLLLFVGLLLILTIGHLLTPVIAAIIIAYLLDGMVSNLQNWRLPRTLAVLIVFVLFMAVLLYSMFVLIPLILRQIGQLFQELPSMIGEGQKLLTGLPERYPDVISQTQINQLINALSEEFTTIGKQFLTFSLASVRGVISFVVYSVLVPFLVFFFLKDKQIIINWLVSLLPKNRGLAVDVWREVNYQIANYVRGKVWEILIVWIVSYISFTMLGLQFAMVLALFVGLSVLLPYIGATVMFFPVSLIALFQWGVTSHFAYLVLVYLVIQTLDGNLLAPLLLSEVVNLHPVAIIVSVLVFGGLAGFWGLFFAIPLATLVHAVIKAWHSKRSSIESTHHNKPENE